MLLSVKVAMLTSLFFIGGMCWMVTQVARPIVDSSMTSVAGFEAAGMPDRDPAIAKDQDAQLEAHLARSSIADRDVVRSDAIENGTLDVGGSVFASAADAADQAVLPLEVPQLAKQSEREESPRIASDFRPAVDEMTRFAPEIPVAVVSGAEHQVAPTRETHARASEEESLDSTHAVLASRLEARAAGRGPAAELEGSQYVVHRGDSLARIARHEWKHVSPELIAALVAANPALSERPDRIVPGQILMIPKLDAERVAARERTGHPESAGATETAAPSRWYTVRKNDSLARIARRELRDEKRWREIARLNQLSDANRIRPGMRLQLPRGNSDT